MCGSTSQQNQIEGEQQSSFSNMNAEAQQVFGENSALYSNLLSAFEPILKAGPDQQGFSAPELSARDSEATNQTAAEYQKASAAVRGANAGEGGGNVAIPSGVESAEEGQVANAAAGEESQLQNNILQSDYDTGRANYEGAVGGLLNAGSVFNPSESLNSESTGAGTAAANTANQIAQANFSPWGAALGAVGGLAGAAAKAYGSYEDNN